MNTTSLFAKLPIAVLRRVAWPATIVAGAVACDELTVDDVQTEVPDFEIAIACRAEAPDSTVFAGSFCQMNVGEVDTLEMTFLIDSVSVTGLRVSWIPLDSAVLSIRTMDQVIDSTTRAGLTSSEALALTRKAEVVALKRGAHLVRFDIDSAGFLVNAEQRDTFKLFLEEAAFFEIRTNERWGQVAAGRDHTCALTYDDRDTLYIALATRIRPGGRAFCWGDGPNGALGTGSFNEPWPFRVATDERFTIVAAGREHSCALDLRAFMLCWGGNEEGRLGTGNKLDQFEPRRLALGIPFTFPALGNEFSCGVPTTTGTDFGLISISTTCWGRNGEGQLGCDDGDPAEPCHFEDVFNTGDQVLPGEDVTTATADIFFSTVAAGGRHACGIQELFTVGGPIWCWGDNTFGQLGVASTASCATVQVASFPCSRVAVLVEGPALTFVQIDAGEEFTCGLTDLSPGTSEIHCWGRNDQGQLGDGTFVDTSLPVRVMDDFTTTGFLAVSTGGSHACALTPEGTAYCWGSNSDGQLGDGTSVSSAEPVPVAGGLSFSVIAAGTNHTCGVVSAPVATSAFGALAGGGPIYCWGDNETIGDDGLGGKLGNGGFEDSLVPVRIVEPVDPFF